MSEKSRIDSNARADKPTIQYTRHFKDMLRERSIPMAFIKSVLAKPEKTEERADGTKHFLRRISEYDNRWLRVVVNTSATPHKAVTAFFDRRLSGKK
jgi:hypothetical protein